MSTLERAIEIAREAHYGQVDKSGCEYIGHPLRVMSAGKNIEEKITGVLHDVLEDSIWTLEMLENEGFSKEIIEALQCLTKYPGNEPYEKYIARIKKNPLATAVKLNDLTDNMDIRRLPYISDKDIKRLKKYLKAYKQLSDIPVYSIEACRVDYPQAYNPWSKEEDTELTKMYKNGATIEDLASHFQRKPGGIRSRIKKLGL